MQFPDIYSLLAVLSSNPFCHIASLCGLVWLTYFDLLHGTGGVSDDLYGILLYRFDWKDPDQNKPPDQWVRGPFGVGRVWRHIRGLVGRVPNPNKNWKRDKQLQWVHNTNRHHRLNIWLGCGVAGMLYLFLTNVTSPPIAWMTTALFIAHLSGSQCIGWISGCQYVVGFFFMLLGLNIACLTSQVGWLTTPLGVVIAVLLYGVIQWIATELIFVTMGAVWILLWLKLWPFTIVAGLFTAISALRSFKDAITLRKAVFKEQLMDQSTKFYPRKLIVVMKSLACYTKFAFFPKRAGLYWQYLYHYELPYAEAEDGYFYAGIILTILLGLGITIGSPVVSFACIWYLAFIILFLNFITANQFFTERYTWIPTVGACLLVAAYAPQWLYWILFGIALMRTWAHLPTYYNETQFYESNLWNFPTSEIASGNLGVTLMHRGLIGSANETWIMGVRMNPEYDVNWYNLASSFKTRGLVNPNYIPLLGTILPPEIQQVVATDAMKGYIMLSKYCLEMALKSRTCHFPKQWQSELDEMNKALEQLNKSQVPPPVQPASVPTVQNNLPVVITQVKHVS